MVWQLRLAEPVCRRTVVSTSASRNGEGGVPSTDASFSSRVFSISRHEPVQRIEPSQARARRGWGRSPDFPTSTGKSPVTLKPAIFCSPRWSIDRSSKTSRQCGRSVARSLRPSLKERATGNFGNKWQWFGIMLTSGEHRTCAKTASARLSPRRWGRFSTPIGSASHEKRPPTEAASPHSSGCTSGARGLQSVIGSSAWDLRSAALSKRAAEILGSVVALANSNRIAA